MNETLEKKTDRKYKTKVAIVHILKELEYDLGITGFTLKEGTEIVDKVIDLVNFVGDKK